MSCCMFIRRITTNQSEYARDFLMQGLQKLRLSDARQYFVAIQLPPSIHRGDIPSSKETKRTIMLFRCLPPFRISHFTGHLTAIGNHTQTGPADMSWSRVFVGLCLRSTQIGRIVLADTLHVEFHPKKEKKTVNPSPNRIHGLQSSPPLRAELTSPIRNSTSQTDMRLYHYRGKSGPQSFDHRDFLMEIGVSSSIGFFKR